MAEEKKEVEAAERVRGDGVGDGGWADYVMPSREGGGPLHLHLHLPLISPQ